MTRRNPLFTVLITGLALLAGNSQVLAQDASVADAQDEHSKPRELRSY